MREPFRTNETSSKLAWWLQGRPGDKALQKVLSRHQVCLDRLQLSDQGILEYHYVSKLTHFWVPYAPCTQCELAEPGETWRYWVYAQVHFTLGQGAHRSLEPTKIMVRRMAWWPSVATDVQDWVIECPSCNKNRARVLKGLARMSTLWTTKRTV